MVYYVFLDELDVQLSNIFLEKFHPASRRNEDSKMLVDCKFLNACMGVLDALCSNRVCGYEKKNFYIGLLKPRVGNVD
jgi:hypothetical protein